VSGGLAAFQARAARVAVPLTVHLELTYRCNLRCIHCFQDHGSPPGELTREEWIAVVDQARAAGAMVLTLSGGEALLSPHFWAVAEHARAVGLALRIFTNGALLGRPAVERLRALRPLAVEVSIFSVRPEKHDAVTGAPGSLARALRGLFRLRRAGVPLVVKCPLLAVSGDDHAAVRRLAERLGASVIFDPHVAPRADGGLSPTRCRGDDATIEAYFADPATAGHDAPRADPTPGDRAPCGMARTFAVVSPAGDLLPCPMLQVSAGSLRRERLDVLWRESPVLARLRARRFGDLRACGTCPRSGYCDRCSASALLEDGDLDGPSSRSCHVAALRERAWGVPPPPGAPAPTRRGLRVLPP
jgi:radical SAM protein with 4Fe4S-binding SPASM domain